MRPGFYRVPGGKEEMEAASRALRCILGSVSQIATDLGQHLHRRPSSLTHDPFTDPFSLDCGQLENRGCVLLFDVASHGQHTAKGIISINPMLKERTNE